MDKAVYKKVHNNFTKYPKRTYPKGHVLVFADENPESIFYIESGKVRKYDVTYRGDEVIVNIFKPPAFFPMSWALNKTVNKFFYKTEEETVLYVVPTKDAEKFLKNNPDVMFDLLTRIYSGMEGILGRMVNLMSGTAKSRLIYELVIESRRFGNKLKNGSIELNLNESDFAARSGLSRETVSREMGTLKQKKLVSIKPGKFIIIKDLSKLEKTLGSDI